VKASITVIIPCFNEEARLARSVRAIVSYLRESEFTADLLFVNDGSTDTTVELIEKLRSEVYPLAVEIRGWTQNRGKGAAVREGMLHAAREWCLICDADLSTPIEDLDRLLSAGADHDVIIGSRRAPGAQILAPQPWYRVIMGKFFSRLSGILLALPVNDVTCGFKLLSREAARKVGGKMTLDRWGYDAELIKIAVEQNCRMKEVGVRWTHDAGSKVRLGKDILRSACELVMIWRNSLNGRYRGE